MKGVPPEHSKFKKGQSGNPSGRPKGSRNRSTVAKKWLEVAQTLKNPITGQNEVLEQQDIMTLALIRKARDGDVSAYRELMDSAYGKAQQHIDQKTTIESLPTLKIEYVKPDES